MAAHEFDSVDPLDSELLFEVEVGDAPDGAVRLAPRGELDMATVPELEQAVVAAVGRRTAVLLDLSGLTFIDSTGVALVLRAIERCRTAAVPLRIAAGPPLVMRTFELLGLLRELPLDGVQRSDEAAAGGR